MSREISEGRADVGAARFNARFALQWSAAAVALLSLAAGIWLARSILMLGFVAVLLAVVLSFPVGWLERVLHRRGLAVIVVLLVGGGALGALGYSAAGPLSEEAAVVLQSAPRTVRSLRSWLDRVQHGGEGSAGGAGARSREGAPPVQLERAAEIALPAIGAGLATVTKVVLVVVLAAFLVNEPEVYRRGLRRLVPPRREGLFDSLWTKLGVGLRRWVGGIVVSMVIMGALTAGGLAAAGIENWALLGTLTFVGTFVPYLGAVASAVPGLLVAAGQSPTHLLLALAVYVGVHLVEGYIVEPFIMRRAVELKPALLLGGLAVFGAILGPLGIVIATPAMVCLQIIVEHVWVERMLHKEAQPGAPARR